MANQKNFFKNTIATFKRITDEQYEATNSDPDFLSTSGSAYWYTDEGVIRYSNHWGYVASCIWRPDADLSAVISWQQESESIAKEDEGVYGFCSWSGFQEIKIETSLHGGPGERRGLSTPTQASKELLAELSAVLSQSFSSVSYQ